MNSVKLNMIGLATSLVGVVTLVSSNVVKLTSDLSDENVRTVARTDLVALALVTIGTILQQVEIGRKRHALYLVTHKYAQDF